MSVQSFLPVAKYFRITPSSLYGQISKAGEPFVFNVSIISSVNTVLPASVFFQSVSIQLAGQTTGHSLFSLCTESYNPTTLLASFQMCVNTTVSDIYDLTVLYDGISLPGMPCLGCIQIIPSTLDVRNTVVIGLKETLLAGTSLSFSIQLRDYFDNIVIPSSSYTISFSPNESFYITNDTSIVSTDSYPFLLYLNHTEIYSFTIYVNDIPIPSSPFTVHVIASQPSFLSSITFLDDENSLVTTSSFQVLFLGRIYF